MPGSATFPRSKAAAAAQELQHQGLQIVILGDLAFPNDKDIPPQGAELLSIACVPLHVAGELRYPVPMIAARKFAAVAASMTMPEASVNEDHLAKARKDEVRRAGQIARVQAVPVSARVDEPANGHLRARVEFPDARHPLGKRKLGNEFGQSVPPVV